MGSSICSLDDLVGDDELSALAGAKASRLARLRALGMPVADGVVVVADSFESDELAARVQPFGARLVVRSSSSLEDAEGHAAPGVFDSFVDVAATDLESHVALVRLSASGERAIAYAEARVLELPPVISVLVQPYLAPSIRGTLYTRLSEDDDRLVIESVADQRVVRAEIPRAGELAATAGLDVDGVALLRRLALDVEPIVGGQRGADIEWLVSAGTMWIVQARPISTFVHQARSQPPKAAFAFATAKPERTWRWDISHNPSPLSFVQRGLVELVSKELGFELELACGYLYQAVSNERSDANADDLEELFFADIGPRLDSLLAPLEDRSATLPEALDAFVEVNRVYADELRPVLSAAKALAKELPFLGIGVALLTNIAEPAHGFSETARRFARDRARRGQAWYWKPYAPRWDVASETFGERQDWLDELIATLPSTSSAELGGKQVSRVAYAVSELDDRLFYRAQRLVRRAILALQGAPEGDLRFDLELATLDEWHSRGEAPAMALARARQNRDSRLDAERLQMPLEVRGDHSVDRLIGDVPSHVLSGRGSGGKCTGRVSFDDLDHDSILVAVDLTPGEALRVASAAAIVLERGSLLGHASALARELGIPIIVGVLGATQRLRQGEPIWIDASAGLIVRMTSG